MASNQQPLGQMIIEVDISSVGFESSLKDMQRALKQNQQKMKAEMAVYDTLEDKIGKLEANYDGLRDSMKLNAKQIDKLKQAYADEVAASGESSEKAQELARQINKTVQEQAKYQKQLDRVTSQLTDAKDGTDELRQSISLLSTENRSIVANFRAQGKELEALEADYHGLEQAVAERNKLIDKEKAKLQRLKEQYGENSNEYRQQVVRIRELETSNLDARRAMDRLGGEMDELSSSSQKVKKNVADAADKIKSLGTLSTTTLTPAISGFGIAAGKTATDLDDAFTKMRNAMGLTENQTEILKKKARNLYKEGYGESMEEITAAITEVRTNMNKLNSEDLSYITKSSMNLGKTFDAEINEVTRGADGVMQSFNLTAKDTFDLLAKGAQEGGNKSKEMFDNLAEYAVNFEGAGFSANEMMSILANGIKAGAYNYDRLNDTMLEFKLRTEDGGKAYKEAMKSLGDDSPIAKAYKEFEEGKITVAEYYKVVQENLGKVKKEMTTQEYENFGKVLFGTKWEDQGSRVVESMKSVNKELNNVDGTMNTINDNVEKSFSQKLRIFINSLKDSLEPLGKSLLNIATVYIPPLVTKLTQLAHWFEGLNTTQQKWILGIGATAAVLGPATFLIGTFVSAIVKTFSAIKTLWMYIKLAGTAVKLFMGPVGWVITGLTLLSSALVYAYKHSETFRNFVNKLRDSLLNTWNNLKAMGVRGVVAAMWKSVKGAFATGYTFVKTKIEGTKNAISNAWTNARKLAVAKVTGMWTSTKNLFSSGYNAVKSRMVSVKNTVSNAWTNTKKATTDKVSSMWTSTKNSFSNGYNAVKNRMSNVKTAMSNSWTAIKKLTVEKVTNMIDHVKKMPQRMADAIAKGAGALKNGGKKLLKGLIGGVEWGLNKVIKGVNQVMTWVGADDSKLKPVDLTKYAKGTPNGGHDGGLAMVNDAPGTNYRELVALPNGQTFVPKGRNVVMNLPQGAEVLPGHKTRDLAKRGVIPQYKSGVGDTLSGLWSSTKSGASKLWQGTKDVSSAAFNKVKDWSTEIWDWVTSPEKVKDLLMNVIGNVIPGEFSSGMVPSMLNGMMKKMVDKAKDFVFNIADSMGGGADFGSWSPFTGDFNKISNKMGVYDYLYDLGKQIVNQFKSQYPSLYISNGKRKESKTKAGTTSDHVYGLGLDLARGGISDNSYYQMAKSLQGHPYLKYVIGSDKWSQNGGEFKKFPYGGHMNHLHLSAKSPAEAKAAKGSFGAAGNVSGSAKAWIPQIKKAHQAIYGRAISKQGLNEVLEQIQTESGGNATVRQGIVDVNTHNGSGGAKGLLQFIQSTFDNYKIKGHGNIWSGYDQLLALFNVSDWYQAITRAGKGKGWSPRSGRVKPYANGGIVTKAHMGLVGEDGPEAIIPLDKAKKGRSMQLLAQASQYLNGNKATTSTASSVEGIVAAIMAQGAETSKKLDALIALLASGTTIQIDGKEIANVVNRINQTNERMSMRAKGVTT